MNRGDIIQYLLDTHEGKNYLEIGVFEGETFAAIKANYKVGVDPNPPFPLILKSVGPHCIYHQTTSDEFFESEKASTLKYDVIFIDGWHEYRQAYKDVINALEHLAPNGAIVVHDSKPTYEIMALPHHLFKQIDENIRKKSSGGAWCGDVYKAIIHLRSLHKDLHIFTLDCDSGCAVITKGAPESMLSFSALEIKAMDYNELAADYVGLLNLKPPAYLYEHFDMAGKKKTDAGADDISYRDFLLRAEGQLYEANLKNEYLTKALHETETELGQLSFENAQMKVMYENSLSWRLTAPIRALKLSTQNRKWRRMEAHINKAAAK